MTNYKVFIWDNDNPGHRIYLVAANSRDEVISKFERTDVYIIIENLKSSNMEVFNSLRKILEDKKII